MTALREALRIRKFPAIAVNVMFLYPGKFLWPDLMSFWDVKSEANISECT